MGALYKLKGQFHEAKEEYDLLRAKLPVLQEFYHDTDRRTPNGDYNAIRTRKEVIARMNELSMAMDELKAAMRAVSGGGADD